MGSATLWRKPCIDAQLALLDQPDPLSVPSTSHLHPSPGKATNAIDSRGNDPNEPAAVTSQGRTAAVYTRKLRLLLLHATLTLCDPFLLVAGGALLVSWQRTKFLARARGYMDAQLPAQVYLLALRMLMLVAVQLVFAPLALTLLWRVPEFLRALVFNQRSRGRIQQQVSPAPAQAPGLSLAPAPAPAPAVEVCADSHGAGALLPDPPSTPTPRGVSANNANNALAATGGPRLEDESPLAKASTPSSAPSRSRLRNTSEGLPRCRHDPADPAQSQTRCLLCSAVPRVLFEIGITRSQPAKINW